MNNRLLELIVCPECKGGLSAEILKDNAEGTINEGALRCLLCSRVYPVIGGVPRLLPDALIGNLFRYHRDFFRKHPLVLPKNNSHSNRADNNLETRTLKSFSFQWNTFGQIFQEYKEHWHDFLPSRLEDSYFRKKLGLDAGCGFGRHLRFSAEAGAEMVGMDLSEAVAAAYRNTKHLKNVHIVQGDIYNSPFRKGTFDFIYSIGVLHHLPNPQKGFQVLSSLLDSKQDIVIWCYGNEKSQKNAVYELLRNVTTRLDFRALYVFTYVAALGIRVFFNFPAMAGKFFGMGTQNLPYDYYCQYPFIVLHADLFDVFSAPSTQYYNQEELMDWFAQSNVLLEEVGYAVSGWTLYGKKSVS
jgi:SAM-dependent methyltransferase/uncharacterized protein YbaR (Trm112 family)